MNGSNCVSIKGLRMIHGECGTDCFMYTQLPIKTDIRAVGRSGLSFWTIKRITLILYNSDIKHFVFYIVHTVSITVSIRAWLSGNTMYFIGMTTRYAKNHFLKLFRSKLKHYLKGKQKCQYR